MAHRIESNLKKMAEEIQPDSDTMDIAGLRELLVRAGILRQLKDNASDLKAIMEDSQVQERTLLLQLYMWIGRYSAFSQNFDQNESDGYKEVGLLCKHIVVNVMWVLLV